MNHWASAHMTSQQTNVIRETATSESEISTNLLSQVVGAVQLGDMITYFVERAVVEREEAKREDERMYDEQVQQAMNTLYHEDPDAYIWSKDNQDRSIVSFSRPRREGQGHMKEDEEEDDYELEKAREEEVHGDELPIEINHEGDVVTLPISLEWKQSDAHQLHFFVEECKQVYRMSLVEIDLDGFEDFQTISSIYKEHLEFLVEFYTERIKRIFDVTEREGANFYADQYRCIARQWIQKIDDNLHRFWHTPSNEHAVDILLKSQKETPCFTRKRGFGHMEVDKGDETTQIEEESFYMKINRALEIRNCRARLRYHRKKMRESRMPGNKAYHARAIEKEELLLKEWNALPSTGKKQGWGHMWNEEGEYYDQVDKKIESEMNYDLTADMVAAMCKRFGDVHLNKEVAKTESRFKRRFRPEIVLIKKGESFIPRKGARVIEVSENCDRDAVMGVLKAYKKTPPLQRAELVRRKLDKAADQEIRRRRDAKATGHMMGGIVDEIVTKASQGVRTVVREEFRAAVRTEKAAVRIEAERREAMGGWQYAVDAAVVLPALAVFIYSVHKLKNERTFRWSMAAVISGGILLSKMYDLISTKLVPFLAELRALMPGEGHMEANTVDPWETFKKEPIFIQMAEWLRPATIRYETVPEDRARGFTRLFDQEVDYKSRFFEYLAREHIERDDHLGPMTFLGPNDPENTLPGQWMGIGYLNAYDGQRLCAAPGWGPTKRACERMIFFRFMCWLHYRCCHGVCALTGPNHEDFWSRPFGATIESYTTEMNMLQWVVENTPELPGEGHGGIESVISTMSQIGAMAAIAITEKTAPQGKMLKEVSSFISNFGKNVEGLHDFGTTAVSLLEGMVNTIGSYIGVDQIAILETSIVEIDTWRDETMAFINQHNKANMNSVTKAEADRLYQKYVRMSSKYPTGKLAQTIRMACGPVLRDLERIRLEFHTSGIGLNGSKPRPVWLHIIGGPGVGKSLAMIPIFRRILLKVWDHRQVPNEELERLKKGAYDRLYVINAFDEFMSGYNEQFAVAGDDFGQFQHATGDPGEFNKYFNMAGEFPTALPMADLGSKGNTYARSEFVITTSNLSMTDLEKELAEHILKKPEALCRRMDLIYYCYPAKEYRMAGWEAEKDPLNWRLDLDKIPEDVGFDPRPFRFARVKLEWNKGKLLNECVQVDGTEEMDLEQMINSTFLEFTRRSARSKAYTEEIDRSFEREVDAVIARREAARALLANHGKGHMKEDDDDVPQMIVDEDSDVPVEEVDPYPMEPVRAESKGKEHLKEQDVEESQYVKNVKSDFRFSVCASARKAGIDVPSPGMESDPEYIEKNIEKFRTDSEFAQSLSLALEKTQLEPEVILSLREKLKGPQSQAEQILRLKKLVEQGLRQEMNMKEDEPLNDEIVNELVATSCSATYFSMTDSPLRDKVWMDVHWKSNKHQWTTTYKLAKLKPPTASEIEQLESLTWMEKLRRASLNAKESIQEKFRAYFEFTGWWGIVGPAVVGALLVGGIAWYMMSGNEAEGHSVHRPMATKKNKKKGAGHGRDGAVFDIANAVWNSAFFTLYTPKGNVATHAIITGFEVIIPRHVREYFRNKVKTEKMKPTDEFTLKPVAARGMEPAKGFKIPLSKVLNAWSEGLWAKRDYAYFTLEKIEKRIDISPYLFAEKAQVFKGDEVDMLLTFEREGHPGFQRFIELKGKSLCGEHSYRVDEEKYDSDLSFEVENGMAGPGDCMSPYYIVDSTSGANKLVGFHIAGNCSTWSLASVFSKDMYDIMDSRRKKEDKVKPNPPPEGVGMMRLDMGGRETPAGGIFQPVARLEKPVFVPWKTELEQAFEGLEWCERKLAPAPIGQRGAYDRAVADYGKPPINIDPGDEPLIKQACLGWLSQAEKAVKDKPAIPRRVLTKEEAVFGGEPGTELGRNFTAMNFSTSPGYMAGEETTKPGKKEWFYRTETGKNVTTDRGVRMMERVLDEEAQLKIGRRPFFVFKNFLKDELRKKAKVEAGMARFISGSPLDLQILFRMYFGAFAAFIQQGHTVNGTAIGLNPFHGDWHRLAQILRRKKGFAAGDFKRYDTSLHPQIMKAICEMINKWYNDGEENAQVRRILFMEITNSRHLWWDVVFEWHSSEPSGHPLTAILNSVYTNVFFRLVFGLKNPKGRWAICEFDDECYCISLGDDHILGVSEWAAEFMTLSNIKEVAERYGMGYTTAEKEEITEGSPLLTFEQVTFLKRAFRFNDLFGEWSAPLNLDTVLEMSLWSRGSTPAERSRNVKQTFDHAVVELSLHSTESYDEWAPKMFSAFKEKYGYEYPIQDQVQLQEKSRHPDFCPGGW